MLEKLKAKTIFMYFRKASAGILFFLVGSILGAPFMEESQQYDQIMNEKLQLEQQVEKSNNDLLISNTEIEDIKSKKDSLLLQRDELNKKIEIVSAEVEKLNNDKLAKEEAERIAKEEEKKKQQVIASSNQSYGNKPSGGTSSGSNSGNGSTVSNNSNGNTSNSNGAVEPIGQMVWKTATGSKYHRINNCGKTNPSTTSKVTVEEAKAAGLTPCSKCY